MKIRNKHIFMILSVSFLLYTASIYLQPLTVQAKPGNSLTVAAGKLVWQKYNCQSCHQLYGLGGYLGPDLTNVYSAKGKGWVYIRALIKSGSRQMPSFALTDEEESCLMDFLRMTDASGVSDPRTFEITATGMIEQK